MGNNNIFPPNITYTCEDIEQYASDYLDGELLPAEVEAFEVHLQKCEQCNQLINELSDILRLAKTLRESPIPEGVSCRLRKVLKEELKIDIAPNKLDVAK